MARARQQFPNNYISSGNISAEFEAVYRYLNSAELGNKTIGELLDILFDENGEFSGAIEFRLDTSAGLQFRVGTYAEEGAGWKNIADLESLRGAPGTNLGQIGDPVFSSRVNYVAANGDDTLDYAFTAEDNLLVFREGVLLREGAAEDYTKSPTGGGNGTGAVTLVTPALQDEKFSILKVRGEVAAGYQRSDTTVVSAQTVFPFEFDGTDRIMVYLNGILLEEGGTADYTSQPTTNTITLTSAAQPGDKVSIVAILQSAVAVAGLMQEDDYVDPITGLILLNRVGIDDDALTQAKVSGLSTRLSITPRLYVQATDPTGGQTVAAGDFWLDTSTAPNPLKYWDGVQWNLTSPESSLPTFAQADALKVVRINASGSGLEYANVDLSSVIPVTQKGAVNGVATLDSTGRLPGSQLPEALTGGTYDHVEAGAIADGEIVFKRIYRQKVRIEAISIRTTSGTCDAQISVNGVALGSTYGVSSLATESVLVSTIEIDALTTSKTIGITISNQSAANTLDVALAYSIVSS